MCSRSAAFDLPLPKMSKRKSSEISPTAAGGDDAAATSSGRPARSKRNTAAASSASTVAAADSSAAASAAASSAGVDEDGDAEMGAKPVRRGGRPAASTDIRPAQQEAMQHVATSSSHGFEYPSFYGFKKVEWMKKRAAVAGPGRQWKNYKQIVERENYHLMEPTVPTCQARGQAAACGRGVRDLAAHSCLLLFALSH
jgi:hypothetical protein